MRNERGQMLPMSLAALLTLTLLAGTVLNLGKLCLDRQRLEHRADAIAFSAGVDTARTLNLLSLSNKGYIAAYIAAYFTGGQSAKAYEKAQQVVTKVTPLFIAGSSYIVGISNDTTHLLYWNQEKKIKLNPGDLVPDLKVENTVPPDISDGGEFICKAYPQKCGAEPATYKKDEFSYYDKEQQKRIELDPKYIKQDGTYPSGKPRWVYNNPDAPEGQKKSTYAKKDSKEVEIDLPLPAAETGRHTLTVVAINDNPLGLGGKLLSRLPGIGAMLKNFSMEKEQNSGPGRGFWRKKPMMTAVSRVEVGGGTMNMFEFDSTEYEAWFIPVDPSASPPVKKEDQTFTDKIQQMALDWLTEIFPVLAVFQGEILR